MWLNVSTFLRINLQPNKEYTEIIMAIFYYIGLLEA